MRIKHITLPALLVAALAPAAASAKKPPKEPKAKPEYCMPKANGYNASGTLVSSGSLTQTAGADTAKRGDDRYSGEFTVNVTKVNHKGLKGEQTFTLTNGRVRFHPRNEADVAAGDRVKLSGKVTSLSKKCDDSGFTPTVTLRKVDVKAAKV